MSQPYMKPWDPTHRLTTELLQKTMDSFIPGFMVGQAKGTKHSKSFYWIIDFRKADGKIVGNVMKIRIGDHRALSSNFDFGVFCDLRPDWEWRDAEIHIKLACKKVADRYKGVTNGKR
jgi:hypothetical protein